MAINFFAMPSSSTVLLFAAALGLTNALPWTGAQKTAVYKEDAWSPVPTNVPADPAKLFKRTSVEVNVCGWIGGNSAEPAGCSSGSSCIHDTIHGYIGCCTTSGSCTAGVYTSCVDQNSAGWRPNSGVQENGVYTCESDSVCNRYTYPGGYYQYGCGASSFATTVQTTYSGQPSDMLLQVVYTGVSVFFGAEQQAISGISSISSTLSSPTSTSASTTASASSSSTSQSSSKSSSSASSSSISSSSSSSSSSKTTSFHSSSTPNPAVAVSPGSSSSPSAAATSAAGVSKGWSGTIVGGTIGGIAGLVAIIALIFFFLRRRRAKQQKYRAPPFESGFKSGNPPPSGPFQRIRPYGPDDFGTPQIREISNPHRFGNTTTVFPTIYEQPEPQPEPPSQSYFPPLSREETPLVSEIDDFSRSFSAAVAAHQDGEDRDTHIHSGDLPDTVTGFGFGVGTSLRRGGSRTEEYGVAREPMRSATVRSASPPIPLRSPRRLTPSPKRDEEENEPQRYQLVDGPPAEDVPILGSPGHLRSKRISRGRYSP